MKRLFQRLISLLKFTLSQVVARCVSRDHNRKVESGMKLNIGKVEVTLKTTSTRSRNVDSAKEIGNDVQSIEEPAECDRREESTRAGKN